MIPDSRFLQTPTFSQDGVVAYAEWHPPAYGKVAEKLHVITQGDIDRPELISYRYYGTTERWWVVLDYNTITDPFSLRVGDRLRIPDWSWGEVRPAGVIVNSSQVPARQPSPAPYTPPQYQTPNRVAAPVTVADSTIFNLIIQLPDCGTGTAHIELQLATDSQYSAVVLSRLTAASIERWFYYDPWSGNGQGAHLPFPANGIDLATYATQPVYFRITTADGMVNGTQYYPRYRIILPDTNPAWQGLPPIIIHTD